MKMMNHLNTAKDSPLFLAHKGKKHIVKNLNDLRIWSLSVHYLPSLPPPPGFLYVFTQRHEGTGLDCTKYIQSESIPFMLWIKHFYWTINVFIKDVSYFL